MVVSSYTTCSVCDQADKLTVRCGAADAMKAKVPTRTALRCLASPSAAGHSTQATLKRTKEVDWRLVVAMRTAELKASLLIITSEKYFPLKYFHDEFFKHCSTHVDHVVPSH